MIKEIRVGVGHLLSLAQAEKSLTSILRSPTGIDSLIQCMVSTIQKVA
jgi:hypothetical protein